MLRGSGQMGAQEERFPEGSACPLLACPQPLLCSGLGRRRQGGCGAIKAAQAGAGPSPPPP